MNMDIAGRLVERRKAAGFSQEDVAERIGVSRQAVSKWECGESSPDTDNLIALANLYCVSIDDLLFGDPQGIVAVHTQPYESVGSEEASEEASKNEDWGNPEDSEEPKANYGGYVYGETGEDYVNISLEHGVHVRDSRKGEEVHVGWDGIHIDDKNENTHVHISFKELIDKLRAR